MSSEPWFTKYNEFTNSMTSLGNFNGMVDDKGRGDDELLYGACFKPIKYKPKYYEKIIKYKANSPWLGSPFEGTFMNAFKRNNEPPVKTYKDLVLWPIPNYRFDSVEGFSSGSYDSLTIILLVIILILIIYYFLF